MKTEQDLAREVIHENDLKPEQVSDILKIADAHYYVQLYKTIGRSSVKEEIKESYLSALKEEAMDDLEYDPFKVLDYPLEINGYNPAENYEQVPEFFEEDRVEDFEVIGNKVFILGSQFKKSRIISNPDEKGDSKLEYELAGVRNYCKTIDGEFVVSVGSILSTIRTKKNGNYYLKELFEFDQTIDGIWQFFNKSILINRNNTNLHLYSRLKNGELKSKCIYYGFGSKIVDLQIISDTEIMICEEKSNDNSDVLLLKEDPDSRISAWRKNAELSNRPIDKIQKLSTDGIYCRDASAGGGLIITKKADMNRPELVFQGQLNCFHAINDQVVFIGTAAGEIIKVIYDLQSRTWQKSEIAKVDCQIGKISVQQNGLIYFWEQMDATKNQKDKIKILKPKR